MSSVPNSLHPSPQPPVPSPNSALARGYLPGLFSPIEPSTISVLAWAQENHAVRKRAEGQRRSGLAVKLSDVASADAYCRATYGHALRFCDLSRSFMEDLMAWRMNQPRVSSPETVNRTRAGLLAVWSDAARRDPPLCYPPPHVPKYKADKRLADAWFEDELRAIYEAIRDCPWEWERPRFGLAAERWSPPPVSPSLWLEAVIRTVVWTGARKDAVLSTPTRKLDLAHRVIWLPAVVQKQRADQSFALSEKICDLWRAIDLHGRGIETLGGDWPYDQHENSRWKTLNRWYGRLLVAAGLVTPGESTRRQLWHKLRRTHATYVAKKHGIGVAQRRLGHSSPQVTMRYIDERMLDTFDVSDCLPDPDLTPPDVIPLRRAE